MASDCPSAIHGEPGDPYGCGDPGGRKKDINDYEPWEVPPEGWW